MNEAGRRIISSVHLAVGEAEALAVLTWVWVAPCGTVSGRDAAVELTGMYSQRVPEGGIRPHTLPGFEHVPVPPQTVD